MDTFFRIEQQIDELEAQIAKSRRVAAEKRENHDELIAILEAEADRLKHLLFDNLDPWLKVLVATHKNRPYTLDYIRCIFDKFLELGGDYIEEGELQRGKQYSGPDPALIGGMARLENQWTMIIGTQKGRDIHERHRRNFGMPTGAGYRKAARLMKLAEKFQRPVISFIDTPGAAVGEKAEASGISRAIAENQSLMALLRVPIIVIITGEGGSGGALGIGMGDSILMLEHAYYSVIHPEAGAAIIWKDRGRAAEMAQALQLTAEDAKRLKIVDEIIPEPFGGAHRDPKTQAVSVKRAICQHLKRLQKIPADARIEKRYQRFRKMGRYLTKRKRR